MLEQMDGVRVFRSEREDRQFLAENCLQCGLYDFTDRGKNTCGLRQALVDSRPGYVVEASVARALGHDGYSVSKCPARQPKGTRSDGQGVLV